MISWTRFITRNRGKVICLWLVLFAFGGAAASDLSRLLSNRFSVPRSDAERGLDLLKAKFGERSDGAFTLVLQSTAGSVTRPAFVREAKAAAGRGATQLAHGKAGLVIPASRSVAFVQITTSLDNQDAANRTKAVRRAIGATPGIKTYLSGFPALTEDTKPIFSKDLTRGEEIAIPIALAVTAFMFGTLGAIFVPFLFALISIPTTLGLVWVAAHLMSMSIYVTNIVTLIGVAIAIDYSMLVVFRFREELARGDPQRAIERTMATAGRATLFSGATVAVGLALLAFMPLPFMRSMGIGGMRVPLVSIAASATLLPALLVSLGHRVNRLRFLPRGLLARRIAAEGGFWTGLAAAIMRRPIRFLVVAGAFMLALAFPVTRMTLTGGDNRGAELVRALWRRGVTALCPTVTGSSSSSARSARARSRRTRSS